MQKRSSRPRQPSGAKRQIASPGAGNVPIVVRAAPMSWPPRFDHFLGLSLHAWDVWNCMALMSLAVGIRWPFIGVKLFDPDEAEFMTSAAYAQATHQPIVSSPVHPYTIATYRLVAEAFGPYKMLPLRIATDVLVGAVAVLVYLWMVRATSRLCALMTAAFYAVYSLYLNGHMVSREIPCSLALVAGAYLFILSRSAAGRVERRLLYAAGAATGAALFFKEQAAYITQAIPLFMVLQAICERRLGPWLGKVLWYAAGGISAGLVYVVPFLLNGTLVEHLRAELDFGAGFGGLGAVTFPQRFIPPSTRLVDQFLFMRPAQLFLLMAYWACLLEIIGLIRRAATGSSAPAASGNPASRCQHSGLLALCYVITSSAAVAMGNRFGEGYFLLWLPFVFAAGGMGLSFVATYSTARFGNPATIVAAGVGIMMLRRWFLSPVGWGLLALITMAIFWEAHRQGRRARLTPWLQSVVLAMLLGIFLLDGPGAYRRIRLAAGIEDISTIDSLKFLAEHAQSGDRLFVWGSRPEYYCLANLEPASRFVVCGYAEGHFFERDGIPESFSQRLLEDLQRRPPRFIIAAPTSGQNTGMLLPTTADASPALAKFFEVHYRRAARLSVCDVYERQ